jgi:hypothetical protein
MSKIDTTSSTSLKADVIKTSRKRPLFSHSPKDHAKPRSKQLSAVTNGTRLLLSNDNRGAWARRCKDIMQDLTSDHGGVENISAAEASIIRRSAVLSVELELLENKFAAGQATDSDLDLYGRTSGNLRRLFQTIGVDRKAKDITPPSVADYIAHINQRDADAAAKQREEAATREADVVQRVDDAAEEVEAS